MQASNTSLVSVFWVCALAAAWGQACEMPAKDTVIVVDGSMVSGQQMLAAQDSLKAYLAQGQTYLACLTGGRQPTGRTLIQHDSAVNEMERLTALFNRQLRAFRKAQTATADAVVTVTGGDGVSASN